MKTSFTPVRYWVVVAILLGAVLFLQSRGSAENLPSRTPVSEFPAELAGWQSRRVLIEPEVIEILGDGDFLQRLYFRPGSPHIVDFFLAYFPTQRTGSTIHSPKNCLPGAGWAPVESSHVELTWPDGRRFPVNQYVISRGLDSQIALYWYQAHGRAVASEYWAKFYLIADAIRMNRSDGALVRVITPVQRGESLDEAKVRVRAFAEELLPKLDAHIPN